MRNMPFVAIAAVSMLAACPEDEGGAAAASNFSVCDAHIGWTERCAGEPDFSYDSSWGETECRVRVPWHYIEPAFRDAQAECFDTLSCEGTDDDCLIAGFHALGIMDESDIGDDILLMRCGERLVTCTEVSDDHCATLPALTEAGRDAAAPCIDLPCEQIEACLMDPGGT